MFKAVTDWTGKASSSADEMDKEMKANNEYIKGISEDPKTRDLSSAAAAAVSERNRAKRPIQFVVKGNLRFKMNGRVKPKVAKRTLLKDIFTNASFVSPAATSSSTSSSSHENEKKTPSPKSSNRKTTKKKEEAKGTKRASTSTQSGNSEGSSKKQRRISDSTSSEQHLIRKPGIYDIVMNDDEFESPTLVSVVDAIDEQYRREQPSSSRVDFVVQKLGAMGYRFVRLQANNKYLVLEDLNVNYAVVLKCLQLLDEGNGDNAPKRRSRPSAKAAALVEQVAPKKPPSRNKAPIKSTPPKPVKQRPKPTKQPPKPERHPSPGFKSTRQEVLSSFAEEYPQESTKKSAGSNSKTKATPFCKGQPSQADVLLGRGNGLATHPGNRFFRSVVWRKKDEYYKSYRSEKVMVAKEVVDIVKKRGGRFLERKGDGSWGEVTNLKVLEKTCQALREKKWFAGSPEAKHPPKAVAKPPQPEPKAPEPKPSPKSKPKPPAAKVAPPRANLSKVTPGTHISVFWPLDNAHYDAIVMERIQNYFFLKYDDNETEWLDLSKNDFAIKKSIKSDDKNKAAKSARPALMKKKSVIVKKKAPKKKRQNVSPQLWSPHEDELLRQAVSKCGTNWAEVVKMVPGRNNKQVRDRWSNSLDPDLDLAPLTPPEIRQIIHLQQELGNKWKEIAAKMDRK